MAVKKWLHVVGVTQVVAEEAAAAFVVVAPSVFAAVVAVAVHLVLRVKAVEQCQWPGSCQQTFPFCKRLFLGLVVLQKLW